MFERKTRVFLTFYSQRFDFGQFLWFRTDCDLTIKLAKSQHHFFRQFLAQYHVKPRFWQLLGNLLSPSGPQAPKVLSGEFSKFVERNPSNPNLKLNWDWKLKSKKCAYFSWNPRMSKNPWVSTSSDFTKKMSKKICLEKWGFSKSWRRFELVT